VRGGAASLFLGGAGRAWRRQQRPDALLRDGKQRPRLREMALLLLLVPYGPLALFSRETSPAHGDRSLFTISI
jgi:hypothetical protein